MQLCVLINCINYYLCSLIATFLQIPEHTRTLAEQLETRIQEFQHKGFAVKYCMTVIKPEMQLWAIQKYFILD